MLSWFSLPQLLARQVQEDALEVWLQDLQRGEGNVPVIEETNHVDDGLLASLGDDLYDGAG